MFLKSILRWFQLHSGDTITSNFHCWYDARQISKQSWIKYLQVHMFFFLVNYIKVKPYLTAYEDASCYVLSNMMYFRMSSETSSKTRTVVVLGSAVSQVTQLGQNEQRWVMLLWKCKSVYSRKMYYYC